MNRRDHQLLLSTLLEGGDASIEQSTVTKDASSQLHSSWDVEPWVYYVISEGLNFV